MIECEDGVRSRDISWNRRTSGQTARNNGAGKAAAAEVDRQSDEGREAGADAHSADP